MIHRAQDISRGQMTQAWREQVLSEQKQREELREVIAQSWSRCREMGVNPSDGYGYDVLPQEVIRTLIEEKRQLLHIARPIMKTLFKCIQGNQVVVVITDERGYILETLGDQEVMQLTKAINFLPGVNWSEASVGTNAIGTALALDHPVQVSGPEHYCSRHHCWTCSAAPIHDSYGRIIGSLDISCPVGREYAQDLGMVVAAVRAVENQLHQEETRGQLDRAHYHLTTVLSSISEGILSVDKNKVITHANPALCRLVGLLPGELIGKELSEIFGHRFRLDQVLETGKSCIEEEIMLEKTPQRIHCTYSAAAIINEAGSISGAVVTCREIKQVHQLVNKMAGAQARFRFRDIVGESPAIQEAVRKGKVAAKSPSTILLLGESGTGKEVFSQAIHNASSRRDGPFIALNCAAMPRELIQSELFGYCEGAFTGAHRGGRPGKFELADGGTLLLDEIGDMPLDMQVNLLRVLQEKNIVRVGGDRPVPVDVRVIAATHKNLEKEVARGSFRQDLYYRLNVVSITIPPLRERLEDVERLAAYFLQKIALKLGKEILSIDRPVLELFQQYPWPGNVRELENVMEHGINMAEGSRVLLKEFLPAHLWSKQQQAKVPSGGEEIMSLAMLECHAIQRAMEKFDGNITKVAQALGIARNTLYEKMKKCNIDKTSLQGRQHCPDSEDR